MPEIVRVNDVDYFVTAAGKGEPLVLLHGFTGSSASWDKQTAVFSTHFRTIAVDLLGHGRTGSPPDPNRYRMETAAADIIAILEKQKAEGGRQKVHLLGYSMGGRLALYLAVNYPEWFQSLILESASPGLETAVARAERQKQDNALANWIEVNGIAAFVDRWEQLPLWASQAQLPPETRLALREQRLQNSPTGLANSLRGMGTGVQPSLWPHLNDLQLPALLITGALDKKFVEIGEQMAETIPSAQLKVVREAGHTVHLEQMVTFNHQVIQFLKQSGSNFGK
jgi:2-succinyl-6-hydroxy-2,4-cyclohexadiene-1-carboxylate synthase